MKKKLTWGAVLLFLAGMGFIGMDQYLKYCVTHPYDSACPSPTPTPTPVPTPSPTPTVEPSPTPNPTPSPSPTISPTPPPNACGVYPGEFYVVNNNYYGQGLDATPTAQRACQWCADHGYGEIGGQPRCGCPFLPDGDLCRLPMELNTLGGCPTWEWASVSPDGPYYPCIDNPNDPLSCDHFQFDDPRTPEWEGNIPECAKQRDSNNHPKAGFYVEAHGDGWVRACDANYEHCGSSKRVQH